MRIAMIASESNPLCKTGGLADVVYSLSKELVTFSHEVIVVLPFYSQIKNKGEHLFEKVCSYIVPMSWRRDNATIYKTEVDGITFYLVENDHYYARNGLYGDFDDGERFAFFALASVRLFSKINFVPDIIHIHDWQAGMVPCLIKENPVKEDVFKNTKFVLSIHNPAFQGMLDRDALGDLYNLPTSLYDNGQVRLTNKVSTLKSAIVYSDKILTVSPNHHNELLTPEGSMGLSDVLRFREFDFDGILNGIDYVEFNPSEDDNLKYNYDETDFLNAKASNKSALFKELNIKDLGKPCFSLVSRLTWQKGCDLLFPACEELANRGCNIIILGSGEYAIEQKWEEFRRRYPEQCAIYIGYNDSLAHRIYAASDYFLMPSLFEPCGLGQMIAQRYGTLPIVRRTGGLKDSVINYDGANKKTANGFGFDVYDAYEATRTCIYAYDCWWDLPLRKTLILNAMTTDNSWHKSALQYEEVYKNLQ